MTNLDEIKNSVEKEFRETGKECNRLSNLVDDNLTDSDSRAEKERLKIARNKLFILSRVIELLKNNELQFPI